MNRTTTEEENVFLLQTIDEIQQALALPIHLLTENGLDPLSFFRDMDTTGPDAAPIVAISHAIADIITSLDTIMSHLSNPKDLS